MSVRGWPRFELLVPMHEVFDQSKRAIFDVTVGWVLIGWAVQTTETRVACGALGRGRWQTEQLWVGEVMDVSLQMLL